LPQENGKAIATGIPNAQLLVLEGIGHELPPRELPRIADSVARHILAAQ
jgi:hypothetical protein